MNTPEANQQGTDASHEIRHPSETHASAALHREAYGNSNSGLRAGGQERNGNLSPEAAQMLHGFSVAGKPSTEKLSAAMPSGSSFNGTKSDNSPGDSGSPFSRGSHEGSLDMGGHAALYSSVHESPAATGQKASSTPESSVRGKADAPAEKQDAKSLPKPESHTWPAAAERKLEPERQRLDKNMDANHVPAEEQARIRRNMNTFETRAMRDHLSADEVRKTYEQSNRLYESKGDSPIPQSDKAVLADHIIVHAAYPTNVDQGNHNTCGATSLESRLYISHPSEAAKIVADVGTTGAYTAKDGSTVRLTENDFKKDAESVGKPRDGGRGYASKLFQETVLNLHFQQRGQRYVETPGLQPGQMSADGSKDAETVVDANGNAQKFTAVNAIDISGMEAKITGKRDPAHYLGNHEVYYDDRANKGKMTTFDNEKDFKDKLSAAKKSGEMPLTVWIDSRHAPFGDGKNNVAGGEGGGHFVTVTDYDEKAGKVSIEAHWGSNSNHIIDGGIPIHDLYEATRRWD